MSAAAIVMMVVTILLVWGGLVASIVALRGGNAALSDEAERGRVHPERWVRGVAGVVLVWSAAVMRVGVL